ncbi:MAG: acyl-CoA carboxylase biotin carboxyl carrier protein subunit, partial [Lysobacter sp.]
AQGNAGSYRIEHAGQIHAIAGARLAGKFLSLRIADGARRFSILDDDRSLLVHDGEQRLQLQPVAMYRHEQAAVTGGADTLVAPMPGRVVVVRTTIGAQVEAGQELIVIEAMKMELSLKAPRAGTVIEVRAAAGDFVDADAVLVALAP